jgi:transposase
MPAPTSSEVRKIIVNLIEQGKLNNLQIAKIVGVSPNTIGNIYQLYKKTGSVEPKPHRGGNPGWFLDSDYPLLKQLVDEDNDATLQELARMFEAKTGDLPAISTLDDALTKLGITRKKNEDRDRKRSGRYKTIT